MGDPLFGPPSSAAVTKREREFEAVCKVMLDQGMKPTPANLYPGFGDGRNIRSNYARIRRRLLLEYGWRKDYASDRYVRG